MNKIVAVLNDFETTDRVLSRAIMLQKKSDALLEVLYVHEVALFDVPDYFSEENSYEKKRVDKEKIQKEIQKRLQTLGFQESCAVLVFIDDTVDRVWTQTRNQSDVLIVTAYHDTISKRLAKKIDLPLLVLKNETTEYKHIVVPIDLSKETTPCIDFAKAFSTEAEIRLVYDYRFLLDVTLIDVDFLGFPTAQPMLDMQAEEEIKKSQMDLFEHIKKEHHLEGDFIEESLSVEEDLEKYIQERGFDLTILCAYHDMFIFSDSISYDLLESLQTDVLIRSFKEQE